MLLHCCCCALSRYHRSSLTLSLTYSHTHSLTHSLTQSSLALAVLSLMMSGDAYLRFGDVITLESGRNCFLSMDPISLTVLWQLSPDRKNAPVNIENCLWKICPRLSYVDQELFQQSKKLSLSAENAEDIAAQASIEKARNERDFNTIKSAVLFGQVVQLQHVLSGLFLNCMTVPSEQDADCFQLRLGPGSSDAYLKVMSMYKIRAGMSVSVS